MRQNDTPDVPDGVRVLTDGGTDVDRAHGTKHTTVSATKVVTREVDGEDVDMLRVPISSTRTDREGDRFAQEALDGMADQIREQQPNVFDNHGLAGSWMDAIPYDARETIGAQMDAEVEQADDGEHELFAYVNPDGTHPEGERLIQQVSDELQPVKFSVGFKILNSDPIEDDAGNEIGREFTDIDEMETSRVGIPANPDASVTHAVAKSGGDSLPGYQMHPLVQLMAGVGPESTYASKSAPTATDGGKSDVETLRDEVDAIRDTVEDLSVAVGDIAETLEDDDDDDNDDDGEDDGKGPCDDNGDCPDGEECVDGECVDADESDDASPDDIDGATDEEIQQRIENLEAALDDGPGASKTGDPTQSDPPTGKDAEPDEGADADEPSDTSDTNEPDSWLEPNE